MSVGCQFATIGRALTLPAVEKGYKYAASHEWAKVDGDVATVGISDHAQVAPAHAKSPTPRRADTICVATILQGELGDVVYVELPDVGKAVKKGETFGVVESVKVSRQRAAFGKLVLLGTRACYT